MDALLANSAYNILYSYHKSGDAWEETKIAEKGFSSLPGSGLVGNQFLHSLNADGTEKAQIYTWTGSNWITTFDKSISSGVAHWVLGDGFLQEVRSRSAMGTSGSWVVPHNWNGSSWEEGEDVQVVSSDAISIQGIGTGFFATRYSDRGVLRINQWTGEKWDDSKDVGLLGDVWPLLGIFNLDALAWNGRAYKDKLVALYPHFEWQYVVVYYPVLRPSFFGIKVAWRKLRIPVYQTFKADAKMRVFQREGNAWISHDFGDFGSPHTAKDPKLGGNFFVHDTRPSNGQVWDGTSWNTQEFGIPLRPGSLFPLGDDLFGEKSGASLSLYRKVQNNLASALTAFVVSKKTVYDPVRGQTSEYKYTYDSKGGLYDPRTGSAKFHAVAFDLPGHGRRSLRFHNGYVIPEDGLSQAESDASYELSGNLISEEDASASGRLVSRKRHTYEVYRRSEWPKAAKSIHLTKTESVINKVKTTVSRVYNTENGLPEKTEEIGSGRKRITRVTWAHQILPQYADLGVSGKHMLGQVAEQRVYEGDETNANLQKCQVTTWATWPEAGHTWHQKQSWIWNGTKGGSSFQPFDYNPTAANGLPWKLLSTVAARDALGRAVQSFSPKGVATCDLYGHSGSYPVAAIEHGRCSEVAVLTGDYDDAQSGKLDITQGWIKNSASLNTVTTHFGSASLHVPAGALGPEKNGIGPASGRDYVFSAWVYPVTVSPTNPIALKIFDAAGVEILPGQSTFGDLSPGVAGGWQFIKRTIPAASLAGGNLSIQVRSVGSAEFHVDDIRFHPVGAMVGTRYLDPRFHLPMAEVSPSGSGVYYEYDGSARVVHIYAEDGQGHKVKRSDVEYHLNGCGYLSETSGTLAVLKSSAGFIPFKKTVHEYGDLWVEPTHEKILLRFAPENPYEDVTIRVDGGNWMLPCCTGRDAFEIALGSVPTDVEIKAGDGQPYHLTIRKPTDCWTTKGDKVSPGRGHLPATGVDGSEIWVAYRDVQDGDKLYVKRWYEAGQAWIQMGGALSVGESSDPILRIVSGTPYVAYLDRITLGTGEDVHTERRAMVKRWNGSGWVPLQGDGMVSKGDTRGLSFLASGSTLWLAFSGSRMAEEGGASPDRPIYVRKWDGQNWVPIGDFISIPDLPRPDVDYQGDGIADGRISDGDAESPSLAIHPDGTPHIAFVGQIKIQAGLDEETRASAKAFIVKKLITAGATAYWGDLVPSVDMDGASLGLTRTGEVLVQPGADRMQIAFGGNTLYAAFAYKYMVPKPDQSGSVDESNTRVLDIRRFDGSGMFNDESHWFPLIAGETPEKFAMATLDEVGDFAFTTHSGQPAVAFVNAHNHDRLTVVTYDGNSWRALGNPAFLPVDNAKRTGALSLAAGTLGWFAAFTQGRDGGEVRDQAITMAAYSGTCPDLTLSELKVIDNGTVLPMNWSFRPYILFLEGSIRDDATSVDIHIAPEVPAQLSKIWVIPSTGPAQTRDLAAGETIPDAFTVGLVPGVNTVDVELISADGHHRNRYHVVLRRLPPAEPTGTIVLETPSTPAFDPGKPGAYQVVVPPDKPSFSITVDVKDAKDVFINGQPVAGKTTVEVDLQPGTNIITVVIITANGERLQSDIQIVRGTASLGVRPILESVAFVKSGEYRAIFGYENLNAYGIDIPAGSLNGVRYQGTSGQFLGQPVRFEPGLVHHAFTVDFDGTPLVWILTGGSAAAVGDTAKPKVRVEMKDNGLTETNISKPQLRLTNQTSSALAGFKISIWLSRQEVPWQEVLADAYYFNPSGMQMDVSAHPSNENLIRVDLAYPSGFSLAPGASTDDAGLQIGLHFRNYYPGQWSRGNDWSWQGVDSVYRQTNYVTVYDSNGQILAGQEPSASSAPQPPPLSKANVFSFDAVWPWRTSLGALRPNAAHKTEGLAGLEIEGAGYIEISHLPMKTADIGDVDSRLLVDFYLPLGQSNPWWKGAVQLVAECPSAGLHSAYIGQTDLTSLPDGQFSTLSFTLPEEVLNVLQGNWRDFQFKWVLNVNQAAEYSVLDNMRFAP